MDVGMFSRGVNGPRRLARGQSREVPLLEEGFGQVGTARTAIIEDEEEHMVNGEGPELLMVFKSTASLTRDACVASSRVKGGSGGGTSGDGGS